MNTEKIIEIAKRNLFAGTIEEAGIDLAGIPLQDMADHAIASEDMNTRLEHMVLSVVEGPFGSLALVRIEDLPNADNIVGYCHAISDLLDTTYKLENPPSDDFEQGFEQGVAAIFQTAASLAEAAQTGTVGELPILRVPVSLN